MFRRLVPLDAATVEVPLALPRGRYRVEARWLLEDLFGFSRFAPLVSWHLDLVVLPQTAAFSAPPPPATRLGPWRPRRVGRRAGDPFDVRPYLAGDDLRRVHWPLYAHSNTLFVRTSEPSPPPTGHEFLVLDTEAASEEVLDGRVSQLLSWLTELEAQGTGWRLIIPSVELSVEREAGPVLAGLEPAPFPNKLAVAGWPASVTLVTGPASTGAEALAKQLAASRRRVRPVVIESAMGHQAQPLAWWSRRW